MLEPYRCAGCPATIQPTGRRGRPKRLCDDCRRLGRKAPKAVLARKPALPLPVDERGWRQADPLTAHDDEFRPGDERERLATADEIREARRAGPRLARSRITA